MGTKSAKPVSFNTKNQRDVEMLKHVSRKNFSGYVKQLIWADMQAKKAATSPVQAKTVTDEQTPEPITETPVTVTQEPTREETREERLERMRREAALQNKPV
jgi:hypothetical protein